MAKKRRTTYRPAQQTRPAQDKKTEARRALDGFINTLAYLGEASELTQASDYQRHSITRDYELLTVMYRENWVAKRIIDTPCEDMTRAWYSVSSEIEQDKLDELAKLEAKHNIKQEITNGLRWARLYGGAAAVIVLKGQEDMLDQPLDYDALTPGCFRGLIVVDRTNGLYPSLELEEDMDDPEFGYPLYYNVILDNIGGETMKIHHSRLIPFRGRMLPIQEEINEDYWGASELEHVYEELQKRNATSANIAQLVFQANVSAIKMGNFGEMLAMGTEQQKAKIMEAVFQMNRIKNNFGLMLMSNEDNYEQHPYSFTGIAEVYESFMMDMAGAAEIPATKLYGRSPQGMNATGESDMKNYYEMLAQLQERNLRPAIEKLLPIMAMSLWGQVPEDMEVVFEPLMTTTPAERADIMSKQASAIMSVFAGGAISQKTVLLELQEQGKPIGAWTNITDEDIENADDEVDQGEGMEDPMGMMGPGGPEMGGAPQDGSQEQNMSQQQAPRDAGRARPTRKQEAPELPEKRPEDIQVKDAADLKKQVMAAAKAGDIEKAKAIVEAYKAFKAEPQADEAPVEPKKHGLIKSIIRSILNLHKKVDNSPDADYNKDDTTQDFNPYHDNSGKFTTESGQGSGGGAHWAANGESVKVEGPTKSRGYAKSYIAEHPHVAKMAEKLKHVRNMVQNFAKDHPDAEEGTYSATTGKPVEDLKGYCVTFHQNLAKDDPFGGYTDDDYAEMCAVAMDELGCDDVNIGYFGNPEVSFTCEDPQKAMDFAIRHNQHSIFDTNTFRTMKNPYYRKTLNPIEGH